MLSQIAILLKNIRQNVNPSVKIFYKNRTVKEEINRFLFFQTVNK